MTDLNKTSRRGVMRTGLGLIAAGTAAVVTRTAHAQDQKIAQELVQYQTTPKDGAQCNKCVNWVDPNQCKIVAGNIAPTGWCVAYAPKEG